MADTTFVPTTTITSTWLNDVNSLVYKVTATGTDSVLRTGADKFKDIVSSKDFGATGDGVTDDTVALQNFLDVGGRLLVAAGTYKISGAGLSGRANTHLLFEPGVVIDYSLVTTAGAPNSPWSNTAFGLNFTGSIGSPISLTSNAASGQNQLEVPDGSAFSAGDWLQVVANTLYETDTSTKVGEFAHILSIVGNTLNLYEPLNYSYTTADSAAVKKMSFCENVTLEGKATFQGAYAGTRAHGAIIFRYCRNFKVSDITSLKSDYAGFQTFKSLDGTFVNVRCIQDSYTGGNMGISHTYGSANMTHTNCYCYDFCHFIDVSGDTGSGGISMNVSATNCHCYEMSGSAFNTHPGAGGIMNFSNNVVQMKVGLTSATPTGMVAIRCQGPQLIAIGNYCYNVTGHGIFHQYETVLTDETVQKQTTIIGNHVISSTTNSTDFPNNFGILVQGYSTPDTVNGVVISGNTIYGFMGGIGVYANLMDVRGVVIANNVYDCLLATSNYGIYCRANTGYQMTGITISGNVSRATGAGSHIYLQSADVGGIDSISITGNMMEGGTYGIRGDSITNLRESNNSRKSVTTKYLIDAASTNSIIDHRGSMPVTTSANPYVVTNQDETIIVNAGLATSITFPAASAWPGRQFRIKNLQAYAVTSSSSNVVPIGSAIAGTAILPGTAGKWVELVSDGTNWIVMQAG